MKSLKEEKTLTKKYKSKDNKNQSKNEYSIWNVIRKVKKLNILSLTDFNIPNNITHFSMDLIINK